MDDSGRIYTDLTESEIKLLALKPINRQLTEREMQTRRIDKHAPCGCGSGKVARFCCLRRFGKLARKAAEGAL